MLKNNTRDHKHNQPWPIPNKRPVNLLEEKIHASFSHKGCTIGCAKSDCHEKASPLAPRNGGSKGDPKVPKKIDLLIRKAPFQHLVKEILQAQSKNSDMRMQSTASWLSRGLQNTSWLMSSAIPPCAQCKASESPSCKRIWFYSLLDPRDCIG